MSVALAAVVAGCGNDQEQLFHDETTPPPPAADFVPSPGGMRRLLARQYVNSVRMLLGDAAAQAAKPPSDPNYQGFDSFGAAFLALDDDSIDELELSANDIAKAAYADPAAFPRIVPCTPTSVQDAACFDQFIEQFGRVAWRRPLAPDEVDRLEALGLKAAAANRKGYNDFNRGIQFVISAMLQSPYFLYQMEVGEPDEESGHRKLLPYEVATRLSLFLTDTAPDEALLDAAEAGDLSTPEGIEAEARELMKRDGAGAVVRNFFGELYKLRELPTTPKSGFDEFTPSLRAAMLEETMRLVDDIMWDRDADARDLFSSSTTFVNDELAAFYKLPPPGEGKWARVNMSTDRGGILGTAGMMARHAHQTETSPTHRGILVREKVLCDPIAPPPPGVVQKLNTDPNLTMKEKLEQHRKDSTCSGCHTLMDTIGLGFERFDAIGKFRTKYASGKKIDPATDSPGVGAFSTPIELGALLVANPVVPRCLVRQLYRSTLGHSDEEGEIPAIDGLESAFEASGYRFKELMVELVKSPAFSYVGEPR